MGCVNCKPTRRSPKVSLSGSDGPSRAQKTTEKRPRKSMQLFLRALLSANSKKSRSSSRIAPEISSAQSNSPSLQTTTSRSVESLHKIFCRSASDSDASFCEEEEIPVATDSYQAEIIETDDTDSDSLTSVSDKEFCEDETIDPIENVRKECYKARAIRNLQEVSTFKDELKALEQSQEEHEMELKLLMALKTSALQSPQSTRRLAKLNASIEKLSKTYNKYEKELYTVKGKRAIGEAMVDYFLTKLNPGLKYSDIYANNNSFYLFPIPEESEEQIIEE